MNRHLLGGLCSLALLVSSAGARPLDLAECFSRVLEKNPTVRAAEAGARKARSTRRSRSADLVPDIVLQDNHSKTNRDFPSFFTTPRYNHQLTATLRQRVFSGGALKSEVRRARKTEEEAQHGYRDAIETTFEEVAIAYLSVLQERETQKVLAESITTHVKRLKDIEAKIKVGVMMVTDRLQANLQKLEDERELLVSRTSERLALSSLRVLLGEPRGALIDVSGELGSLEDLDADSTIEAADPGGSPALQALYSRVEQAREQVRGRRGAFRPTVDLEVRQNHIANGLSFASTDPTYTEAMGVVTFAVFDGGKRRSDLGEAKHEREALEEQHKGLRDRLSIEADQSTHRVREAEARFLSSEERVRLATKNREVTQSRYLQGVATQAQLLDADVAFRRARLDRVESRFDILRNLTTLLRVTGRLQEVTGVSD